MSGSTSGKLFKMTTWGESHGKALGVSVDGCPAGVKLSELDIQAELNRRKPTASSFSTKRKENDEVQILSGVFDGITTGTPISLIVYNTDERSRDYSSISDCYRPGHADYGYDMKYGFRDYRGGGRSSGRETVSRVAAYAIAKKILLELGISIFAYTKSIGSIEVNDEKIDLNEIFNNPFFIPDKESAVKAAALLNTLSGDSVGGTVECVIKGVTPGIGEPVFDKLDAELAKGIFSIGGVKGLEFGLGFAASKVTGSENNDAFFVKDGQIYKETNNSGGILGGFSDGGDIIFRTAFKPTPSIYKLQKTVNNKLENIEIQIKGRHDQLIVPRAVVVVEAMAGITIVDLILQNMTSRIDYVKKIYNERNK